MPHVHHPEGDGREDEPEAVDENRTECEGDGKRDHVERADVRRDPRQADPEDDRTGEDVHHLPDPHLAHAHEHLGVLGLRQREVELPVAHLVDQARHVRLDRGSDEPAHHDLDPEHAQELGLRPPVQLFGVRVDERQHDEPGHERDRHLEERDEEVDAVLELVQDAELEVEPARLCSAFIQPTAE